MYKYTLAHEWHTVQLNIIFRTSCIPNTYNERESESESDYLIHLVKMHLTEDLYIYDCGSSHTLYI